MIKKFLTHTGYGLSRAEYYGKSTDTKPTEGVENADIFYEMDTKKAYMFDGDTKTWLPQ
jgi:hypothetical protein